MQGFFCLFYVRWGWENKTGKKSFAQLGKKQVLRALGENHLSGGRALGWVGENTSAIAFLFFNISFFLIINEMKQTKN